MVSNLLSLICFNDRNFQMDFFYYSVILIEQGLWEKYFVKF